VQAFAVRAGLFSLYVAGFGMARLWAMVFHRKLLRLPAPTGDSYWRSISLGDFDQEDSIRQS